MVYRIKPKTVKKLLRRTGTKIGFVRFVKVDGRVRNMWFHGKIPRWMLNGNGLPYDPDEHHITAVRDVELPKDDCIRMVPWDRILFLSINHNHYYLRNRKGFI